ncbi:MAG: DUF2490 domain-containing protein [Flavobacteriales bacterium]|nr:DUF2490 domain-containing protein [Flavobacteriales bacterium]
MMKNVMIIIALCWSINAIGQSAYQDFGTWARVKLTHKMHDFKPYFSVSHRTNNNAEDLKSFILQLGTTYKINKHLKLGGAVRSFYEPNIEGNGAWSYRYIIDLKYGFKAKKIMFTLRNRFQSTFQYLEDPSTSNRFLISADRKIVKRLRGLIGTEFFLKLERKDDPYFNRHRIFGGLEYRINKKLDIAAKYIRINKLNVPVEHQMNIISVGAVYAL